MSEKKELSNEELEEVTGGYCDDDGPGKYLPSNHGPHLPAKDAQFYVGHNVYVVHDWDREEFYWGQLVSSELNYKNIYIHKVYITGRNDYFMCDNCIGKTKEYESTDYTLFL